MFGFACLLLAVCCSIPSYLLPAVWFTIFSKEQLNETRVYLKHTHPWDAESDSLGLLLSVPLIKVLMLQNENSSVKKGKGK